MPTRAMQYVSLVVAAGIMVLAASLTGWACPDPKMYLLYFGLSVVASVVKLRLPGMPGTYSLNFLFLLAGVAYFNLPETLVAGCAAALAQSVLNTKKRPTAAQIAFNMANLTLSISLCFVVAHGPLANALETCRPAVLAAVAFLYFVTNTGLVSGVLSLLEGKPLAEVCQQWYVWSFPYYLVGAGLVGQLPAVGRTMNAETWWVLLPLVYLVHFFYGLAKTPRPEGVSGGEAGSSPAMSLRAKLYLNAVMAGGLLVVAWAALYWHSDNPIRFLAYLSMAALASLCKVHLPGMTGTISMSFVVLLVVIVELSLPEAVLVAAVAAAVQCVWKTRRRPEPVQVFFSIASLILSTALASLGCRLVMQSALAGSLPALLGLSTVLLYFSNTILVSAAVCMTEGKPLSSIWQRCYFWSFPYYLVGAVAAGLMVATNRAAGWQDSLLVFPVMTLVYVSYRLHVCKAAQESTAS